ncbi:M15 family metallopeptidase [Formosa algae]|uniref:LAS superfamily LD-carboxypeptidase LdcB n=2 Tax=Formosa algae TaxID=225843 RepID=A0A9X0YJW6_9FLAO|nr:M15 family metallopeptidase [Formosa algae]MBP1839935.1 LAS superfamily LD-carboxypeptidase LdcB [Formosa algae]
MKFSFIRMPLFFIILFSSITHAQDTSKAITKDFVLGKFDFKTDACFVKVAPELSNKTIYLQQEVYNSFLNMIAAAKQSGIQFTVVSGTRNFNYQKSIWDRKWKANGNLSPIENAKKILRYSSMPSTSRHHWGTDLDLNNLSNSYFESGKGLKEYTWLLEHAHEYGFYQVYTSKENGRTGYNEEKWHWSYMPLSSKYLTFYNAHITDADITGFEGSELASELHMISNYVNGISKATKAM